MTKDQVSPSIEVYKALHVAIQKDDAEMLMALIETHKFDINYQDASGNTLLHAAIMRDAPKVAEFLITQGTDIDKVNNEGVSSKKLATLFRHKEILQEMEDFQNKDQKMLEALNVNTSEMSREEQSFYSKNTKALIEKYNGDINSKDTDGNTLLHKAIKQGLVAAASHLISWGADVEIRNNEGKTPEMLVKELPQSMGYEKTEFMRHINNALKEIAKTNPDVIDNTSSNLRIKDEEARIPVHDVRFDRIRGKMQFIDKLGPDGAPKIGKDGKVEKTPRINYTNISSINAAWDQANSQYSKDPIEPKKVKFATEPVAESALAKPKSVLAKMGAYASKKFISFTASFSNQKKQNTAPIIDPRNENDSFAAPNRASFQAEQESSILRSKLTKEQAIAPLAVSAPSAARSRAKTSSIEIV